MKIPTTLLLSILLFATWACKPKDAAPPAPAEPAAATPEAPTSPPPAPQPEPAPEPTPAPEAAPQPAAPAKLDVGSKVSLDAAQAAQALNEANLAKLPQKQRSESFTKFQQAAVKGDLETMVAIADEIENENPNDALLKQMKIDLMLAKKDWAAVESALDAPPSPSTPHADMLRNTACMRLALVENYSKHAPPEILAKAATALTQKLAKKNLNMPMEWIALSNLQFLSGETEAAKQSARSSIHAAGNFAPGRGIPATAFQKFADEVDAGRLPTMDNFTQWLEESMSHMR